MEEITVKTENELREVVKRVLAPGTTSIEFAYGEGKFRIVSYGKDEFALYVEDGGYCLCDSSDTWEVASCEELIVSRINDFNKGIVYCSDCGEAMPYEEVKGYKRAYFAGRYCQKCWDTKWKEIEARESYN